MEYEESLKIYRDNQGVLDYAIEKGYMEGIEKGLKEGIEKGMQKGLEKGMEKGLEKGLEKGMEYIFGSSQDENARNRLCYHYLSYGPKR